jgi:hypothetical protein
MFEHFIYKLLVRTIRWSIARFDWQEKILHTQSQHDGSHKVIGWSTPHHSTQTWYFKILRGKRWLAQVCWLDLELNLHMQQCCFETFHQVIKLFFNAVDKFVNHTFYEFTIENSMKMLSLVGRLPTSKRLHVKIVHL